jgi:hypothetical protein
MTCEELIFSYFGTLRKGFACSVQSNGRLAVVTPYLYPDHDNIEVYVRQHGGRVVVSDMGETLRHLDTQGMDVCNVPNHFFAAERIAGGFGVAVTEGVLRKEGPSEQVGELVFDVLGACKAVAALIYGNRSYEPANFDVEVIEYLEEHGLHPEPGGKVRGQTGEEYPISLRVPTPRGEFYVKTISPKTNGGVRREVNATFRMWHDVNGQLEGKKLSVLNDDALRFKESELIILRQKSGVYRWTERQGLIADLKAGSLTPSDQ